MGVSLLFLVVTCCITFMLLFNFQGDVDNKFWFSTFCIQYSVYIIQFVLSMIPEPRSKRALQVEYEVSVC